MELDTAHCYQALLTHDARFDGVLFVGVSTTRIYCRTVCTARTPRPDYRPCLRCRPEPAPGLSRLDSGDRLAGDAAIRIEAGALAEGGVAGLALERGDAEASVGGVCGRPPASGSPRIGF